MKKLSRQRISQLKYPERDRARKAIYKKVLRGFIPNAKELMCVDCSKNAECYDHAKGYNGANKFYVEAVCWSCHRKREVERRIHIKKLLMDKITTKAYTPNMEYTQEELAKIGFEIIEARRKGGRTVFKKYGPDHFSKLGKLSAAKKAQNKLSQ